MQDAIRRRGLSMINHTMVETYDNFDMFASSDKGVSDAPDIQLVLDVLFIFMSGIAIIVGLIILVYALVVLFDRYCGCGRCVGSHHDEEFFQEDIQANESQPTAVEYKARLWGLTTQERRKLLKQVFASHASQYRYAAHSPLSDELSKAPTQESLSVASHDNCNRGANDLEGWKENPLASSVCIVTSDSAASACIETSVQILPSMSNETTNAAAEGRAALESSVDSMVLNEQQLTTTTCAICLGDYENGDRVLRGVHCGHVFHYDCIMSWMEQRHDHCPYCRVAMVTPKDMRRAAHRVLDKQRLEELSWGKKRRQTDAAAAADAGAVVDMTTSPASNVSEIWGGRRRNAGLSTEERSIDETRHVSPHGTPVEAQDATLPDRDVLSSTTPQQASALQGPNGGSEGLTENPDVDREALSALLDGIPITCIGNSADA